jgi:competence protein ComEC
MSDGATVAMAAAAWTGAVLSHPGPLSLGVAAIGIALVLRRPAILAGGVLALTSALGASAWSGLGRDEAAVSVAGWVTLVTDPADVSGAVQADVRLGRRRLDAWARGDAARAIAARSAGDRVLIRGRTRPVPAASVKRLAVRHIGARLTVDSVHDTRRATGIFGLSNALRRRLVDGARSLPPDDHALFTGVVLGDDRAQRAVVVDDFRAAGLTHLLAVSGQNVAFTMLLVSPLLRLLRRRARVVAALGVLAVFGTVTRWEASVISASAMAGVAIVATARGQRQTVVRVLALAVTGALLLDPMLVHAAGFRLSVAATAGIAVLAPRLADAIPGPRWLRAAVAVPLAAEVAVAPLLVGMFGPVPLVSLPANLAAAPLAGPLMAWGMAAGLVAGFTPLWVGALLHVPTTALTSALAAVARTAAGAPIPAVGPAGVGIIAGLVGLWLLARSTRARVVAALLGFALCSAHVVLSRPGSLWARPLASGVTAWRSGGATVVAIGGARPADALAGLRLAQVRGIDVVVLTTDAAGATLAAILDRHRIGMVVVASRSRFAGTRVRAPGARLRVQGLTVDLRPSARGLTLAVARAPPE